LTKKIQEGIYYNRLSEFKNLGNHSYAIIFLRVLHEAHASQVGSALEELWHMYKLLKKGKIADLPNSIVPNGRMSVLIGYGPKIFEIRGVNKKVPKDFDGLQFLPANPEKPILEGSGIKYVEGNTCTNLGISEHIAIQFISETQLAASRAIVETWKHITHFHDASNYLQMTKFYTGFQRDDGRSWLGFHDELSNMRDAKERKDAISIDSQYNQITPDDYWTIGGTYMSFLRMEIDLGIWQKIERKHQELIVGRDKVTGRPLVGIDKRGNPLTITNSRKPCLPGKYDPKYHDHPDYFKPAKVSTKLVGRLDNNKSIGILSQSHIGRTRHIGEISSKDPTSRRIFRQGFEFMDPLTESGKNVKVGLNFVSFQNDPRRLFFILTDPRWLGNSNFGAFPNLTMNLVSVQASGMFFVPPVETIFPGYSIFK
jgi:deferrochelatase/peroxidase EfeB